MENQTPFLFQDLDIRISKISNGEEEIKEEDKNISTCDWVSNRNLQNSSKEHSTDPNNATETKTQFDHLNSQSKFLADNNAMDMDDDARSLKSVIKSNADHQDLQTEKRKQKKKVGHMKNDWKVSKVCIKTQIGKFQCKECEKQFSHYEAVRNHYNTKHTDKVYNCTHCPFMSKRYYGLKYHFKLRHLNNDSEDYLNDDNSSLQMVERSSKVEFYSNKLFQCTECGKQYTTVIAVKTHYKREHINKVYNCDQCQYIAKDKGSLNEHMKTTHSKKEYKEYKCEYCEQVFEHVLHLRAIKHARSPHDHSCHKCDKAFIYNNQLRKHINVNHPIIQEPKLYTKTKDGRYSCNVCNKQFAQNGGVNRHYRKDHLHIVHDCNLCTYSATEKYDLQSHIKFRHSGIGFTCEYCQQTFQLKYAHKEHLTKRHNFQCGQCDKAFVRNDQLQVHIKVYHEGKETSHHCKICNKMVIKLREHNNRMHTKIEVHRKKSVQCPKCKAEFKTKKLLKKHKCIKPVVRYY